MGVRISQIYAIQACQLWARPEGQQGGLPQAHRWAKLVHKKHANFGPAKKVNKEAYHEAHQMAENASARRVICMHVEMHHLVPLTTTKLMWPNTRPTRCPITGNAKLGMGVEDVGYGNDATLEMKMKSECHRNRLGVRTNKAINSSKAVGISAPANVNGNHRQSVGSASCKVRKVQSW
jgi:hypothetical protein